MKPGKLHASKGAIGLTRAKSQAGFGENRFQPHQPQEQPHPFGAYRMAGFAPEKRPAANSVNGVARVFPVRQAHEFLVRRILRQPLMAEIRAIQPGQIALAADRKLRAGRHPRAMAFQRQAPASGSRQALPSLSQAFTLVELLVVIAVIGILAALIAPAIASAKAKADNARCTGNQRQIALGMALYVADAGHYPIGIGVTLSPPGFRFWMSDIETYVGSRWPEDNWRTRTIPSSVYSCPGYNRVSGLYGSSEDYPAGAYGYNYYGIGGLPVKFVVSGAGGAAEGIPGLGLGGELPPDRIETTTQAPLKKVRAIPEARIQAPSDMIMIGDAVIAKWRNEQQYAGAVDLSSGPTMMPYFLGKRNILSPRSGELMLRRHGGRCLTGFTDGHVESGKLIKLFDFTRPEAARRWNNDNLPHSERAF